MPDVEDAGIEDFYALVGSKVRSARLAADLSQEFLAHKVGLTRSSVANLEAGRQRIALHLFAAIANALNKDACELLPERSQSHRGAHYWRPSGRVGRLSGKYAKLRAWCRCTFGGR